MSSVYIATCSHKGLERLGRNNVNVTDQWELIDAVLRKNNVGVARSVLAQPTAYDSRAALYDWYVSADESVAQKIECADSLSNGEFHSLVTVAKQRFQALRDVALFEAATQDDERKRLGELMLLALNHPLFQEDKRAPEDSSLNQFRQNLYRVDGQPALINWGTRARDVPKARNDFVIKEEERIAPPPPKDWSLLLCGVFWLLFALICALIFAALILGCGFFSKLGFGPQFCLIDDYPGKQELATQQKLSAELKRELNFALDQITEVPVCDTNVPVGLPPRITTVDDDDPNDIISPEDIDDITSEGGFDLGDTATTLRHQEINDLIRDVGAGSCDGIELLAVWDAPTDIDLRAYCPSDDTDGDIPEDRIVDAYYPDSCGILWDIGSSGDEETPPFIERICMGEEAEVGEYLVTVFHDAAADEASVPVRVIVRQAGLLEDKVLSSVPASESGDEDVMLVVIDAESSR